MKSLDFQWKRGGMARVETVQPLGQIMTIQCLPDFPVNLGELVFSEHCAEARIQANDELAVVFIANNFVDQAALVMDSWSDLNVERAGIQSAEAAFKRLTICPGVRQCQ